MSPTSAIDQAFRDEWPALVATLRRDYRDRHLAEDAAQQAFEIASTVWARDGVPDKPGAWLVTTARHRAIDSLRRDKRLADRMPDLVVDSVVEFDDYLEKHCLLDDELAMIFASCHPALPVDAQVALTLRYVAGLSTAQIASAFRTSVATMAKRLVRAKSVIIKADMPFDGPIEGKLAARTTAVCAVTYAIFIEGHTASDGESLVRGHLCDEAIWLARNLCQLLPADPEVAGLSALLHLTDARRTARTDADGLPVALADQDRRRWDQAQIIAGLGTLAAHTLDVPWTPYRLRAAVAALHTTSPSWEDTNWNAIVGYYETMVRREPTPIVRLNRAAAIAERDGPAAGLEAIEPADAVALADYHHLHATSAGLLRRLGDTTAAAAAYDQAISCCNNTAERRWLANRRSSLPFVAAVRR